MRRRGVLLGLLMLALVTMLLVGLAVFRARTVPATPAQSATTPAAPSVPTTIEPPATSPEPDASASAEPEATPSATPSAAPAQEGTLVVLGDGYAKDAAWVDQLGEELGMEVVNLSEEGMGYRVAPDSCADRPCTPFGGQAAKVADAEPDVLVVIGGEADGDFDLVPSASSALSALRKGAPGAEVVVVSPVSAEFPRPYWLTMHTRALKEAAGEVPATWVDASGIAGTDGDYDDGVLTDDAGGELARAIAAAVQ